MPDPGAERVPIEEPRSLAIDGGSFVFAALIIMRAPGLGTENGQDGATGDCSRDSFRASLRYVAAHPTLRALVFGEGGWHCDRAVGTGQGTDRRDSICSDRGFTAHQAQKPSSPTTFGLQISFETSCQTFSNNRLAAEAFIP